MSDEPQKPAKPQRRQLDRFDAIERALALLSEHWDEVEISVKTHLPDKSYLAARRSTPELATSEDD